MGSTVALAVAALARKLAEPVGLVTALPPFRRLSLPGPEHFVLGGHEIRRTDWCEGVAAIQSEAGLFDEDLARRCRPLLRRWSANLRPGTAVNCGKVIARMADWPARPGAPGSLRALVDQLGRDIRRFKARRGLRRVVVVNVASTEPLFSTTKVPMAWPALDKALSSQGMGLLPASSLYALAAVLGGHAYVNFTPSLGASLPAVAELAERTGAVFAGNDGKTGETLVKSVLAPMFAARNLRLLSWSGHNIIGNRDGRVLSEPDHKRAKIRSKGGLIADIVGYRPQTPVSIEFVQSLHDWKTAWDFIHFEGLLRTKMSLQFIWQGSDSVLAAPLVIDLARLAAFHQAIGGVGAMPHLACFFKRPIGVREQDFFKQFRLLTDYAAQHVRARRAPALKHARP